MKRLFLFTALVALTLSTCERTEPNDFRQPNDDAIDMRITLENNEHRTVIYDGRGDWTIITAIKKATGTNNPAKAIVNEGVYIVELSGGKKYSVQNNHWIYDENRGRILRCSILAELRGHLLDYLKDSGLETPY